MIWPISASARRRQRALVALAALLAAACGPRIDSFEVAPRAFCRGDEPRVTWRVRGTPTLLVRLADPRLDSVADDPELALAPDTLVFTLVASKDGKEAVRQIDIERYAASAASEIVFPTRLAGDTVIADGTKNPERWTGQFVVAGVASASGRPLVVRHEGRAATVDAAGATSMAFSGTPLQGAWEFRAVLSEMERARPETRPDRLRLHVTMTCKGAPR